MNKVSAFLMEKDDGWYFTGSLTAGQMLAWQDRYSNVGRRDNGVWFVNLNDSPTDEPGDDVRDLLELGIGQSLEEAWRYALGAYFGPADADYFETGGDERLGEALNTGTWPAVSTGNVEPKAWSILILGDLGRGFTHYGPMLHDEAVKYGENHAGGHTEWWVMDLKDPKGLS